MTYVLELKKTSSLRHDCHVHTLTADTMRLLNIHSLDFRTFPSDDKPRYAIASHRWVGEEITYQQFVWHKNDASIRDIAGYKKILAFCEFLRGWEARAIEDGSDIDWVWIDTCCINKESSTELSEAINSMYRWYAEAWVCLAYLHDVSPHAHPLGSAEFADSEWFTRGWTLQELLAPPTVCSLSGQILEDIRLQGADGVRRSGRYRRPSSSQLI